MDMLRWSISLVKELGQILTSDFGRQGLYSEPKYIFNA